jgi:hypothetical protein
MIADTSILVLISSSSWTGNATYVGLSVKDASTYRAPGGLVDAIANATSHTRSDA